MSTVEQFKTNLPSMLDQRYACAAAALLGDIFVIGGRKSLTEVHKTGEIYNIATKQWIPLLNPMSIERSGPAAVAFGDDILVVVGGRDEQGNFLSSAEQYNTITGEWSSFPSLNSRRDCCAAGVVDGRLIVAGGHDGKNCLASVEEYDPTTQKWVIISPMRVRRYGCAATVSGGKFYVMGGYSIAGGGMSCLSSAEFYNPKTKQWTLINAMSIARGLCAAASSGEKVIIAGGHDGFAKFSSCEAYDTATNQWSNIASMSIERRFFAAVELGGTLYVVGGETYEGTVLSSMESLLIQPNSQTQTTASPPALTGSLADQAPPSQLPHTMQLLQEKIPTADFPPVVTAEVVQAEESCISESMDLMSLNENLLSVSTEEICQWLSRHGLSTASLDIIRQEEIDGTFLFSESFDEIKNVLKGEGMKAGQVSKVRLAIEKAKREGDLLS